MKYGVGMNKDDKVKHEILTGVGSYRSRIMRENWSRVIAKMHMKKKDNVGVVYLKDDQKLVESTPPQSAPPETDVPPNFVISKPDPKSQARNIKRYKPPTPQYRQVGKNSKSAKINLSLDRTDTRAGRWTRQRSEQRSLSGRLSVLLGTLLADSGKSTQQMMELKRARENSPMFRRVSVK